MKIFACDPDEHAEEFATLGWSHIRRGATDEFCDYVRDFVTERRTVLRGKGIAGAKNQFLLDFPPDVAYTDEIFDTVARLCTLDRDGMTLSERHVKWYDPDAQPNPRPHKDRFASQVSLGISIDVPEGSHVVIYPDDDTETNPLVRAGLIDTLPPDELPEVTLRDAREVKFFDAPGDIEVFYGARFWHLRRNAAGTMVVYFKLNNFGCDPLGEDPTTESKRADTLAVLDDPTAFPSARPRLSRRFESVSREYPRSGRGDWLNVNVWDQPPRRITEGEHDVLRSLDGSATVEQLANVLPDRASVERAVRRLAELGAVDL